MKKWSAWLLAAALFFCRGAAAQSPPLTVGILPYLSPNVLIGLFQPVGTQIERELGRPVELYTAADVKTFLRRTLRPDFDIVITAAHHARLAQKEAGYIPLVRFSGPLRAAVAVGRDSAIGGLADLRGKRIAVTDRTLLVNIVIMKLLADLGVAEADLSLVPVNSQNTGILALRRGEVDAALIAHFALDQIPGDQRQGVRVVYLSEALPNVTLLVKASLPAADQERIRSAVLQLEKTPEGRKFLKKSRFDGVLPADKRFMQRNDGYLRETRRQLGP